MYYVFSWDSKGYMQPTSIGWTYWQVLNTYQELNELFLNQLFSNTSRYANQPYHTVSDTGTRPASCIVILRETVIMKNGKQPIQKNELMDHTI
jgi:hypothetical protein